MRGLLWVTVVLAALWGGWWAIGARGAKTAAENWFASQNAQGIDAHYDDLSIAGFPNRFDLTITRPVLADPARGIGWSAPFAQLLAMSWKPWHLIAAVPGGQVFTLGPRQITLDGDKMMASLLMVPGPDLALSETVVQAEGLSLGGDSVALRGLAHMVASIRVDGGDNSYRFGLLARDMQLAPEFGAGDGPGDQVAQIRLDGHATLSAPLDRHAGQNRPHLTALSIDAANAVWGTLQLTAEGALQADAQGFASGEIALHVTGWRHLPAVLVTAGVITADFAPALTRGLEVMAAQSPSPDQLDIALVAKAGQMRLGPLPLGPAPWWGYLQ